MSRKSKILKSDTIFFVKKVLILLLFLGIVTILSPDPQTHLLVGDIKDILEEQQVDVKGTTSQVSEPLKVKRVIDGDTIVLETDEVVRYIGIDAPESRGDDVCFSDTAKKKNEELVLGKRLVLEKDISETDRYGRLLRYVYVENPSTSSGQTPLFVNEYLAREGYAKAATYPPDVKYQQRFLQAEREAFELQKGLWSGCY